jgi:sialate O-acetylesterase
VRFRSVLLLISFFLSTSFLSAEPKLPHLFSDHMVFQRGAPIRVWGRAEPGEIISVALAGQTQQTTADADSRWRVELASLPAGGPFVLQIRGKKTVEFKDVMIGEVWVASGQSNMAFGLGGAANASEVIPKADDPGLRFFTVPKRIAMQPQTDTLPAAWEVCTSETATRFSAVGFFFARDLRRSLQVPVGIILSAWPGTAAEEWTAMESMKKEVVLQPIVAKWEKSSEADKQFAAGSRDFSLEFDDFVLVPADAKAAAIPFSSFDDGASSTSTGGEWSYSWAEAENSTFELVAPGRGGKGYAGKISGKLDGTSGSYWKARFHLDGSPANLSSYAGVRFWARGNGSFGFRTLQPTIYDWDDYASEVIKATPEWKEVTIWFKDLKQAGWGVRENLTLDQLVGFALSCMSDLEDPPRPPAGLYEGMIAPLESYRIRGAIWYQGESNTFRAYQYRTLLPAMISSWRVAWGEGDFPFLIVQLPNQGHSEEFADSWWAELREAQLLTAKNVPNTGLAVTIDVGDPNSLHPPRKQEVGERLALWALGTTYGKKVVYSGPLYEGKTVQGKEMRIRFQHTGMGLQAHGGALQGFSIAGADKRFHHADARIEGDAVMVSSAEVDSPVAVRYDWANSPGGNLYNNEGLPASPFRTDDWPGATDANR